jgi:hypothetical protein
MCYRRLLPRLYTVTESEGIIVVVYMRPRHDNYIWKLNLSAPVSIEMSYHRHLARRLAGEGSKFFERYNEELRQRSAFPLDFSLRTTHLRD